MALVRLRWLSPKTRLGSHAAGGPAFSGSSRRRVEAEAHAAFVVPWELGPDPLPQRSHVTAFSRTDFGCKPSYRSSVSRTQLQRGPNEEVLTEIEGVLVSVMNGGTTRAIVPKKSIGAPRGAVARGA